MASKQTAGELVRRYPIAAGGALLGILLVLALGFRFGKLAEVQAIRDQQEAESKKLELNVRNAVGIEEDLKTVKASIARLEAMLIRVDDVSGNQEYFYRLESGAGIHMSILRPTGSAKARSKDAAYVPTGFNVVIEGAFPQILTFLREAENGEHLYRLTDFTLQRSSQGTDRKADPVVLNLNLQLLAAK